MKNENQNFPADMDTAETIPPFIFVDGRKYVLDDTDELPEPEIFGKLIPPPRNVTQLVQRRLLLSRENDMLLIAVFIGALCGIGLGVLCIDGFSHVCFMAAAFVLPLAPFVVSAVFRVRAEMRNCPNVIRLLQNGFAGKGRFVGMSTTGKKVDNRAVIQLQFQFTTQEDNTQNIFLSVTDMRKMMQLSNDSLKLVLYDPEKPGRNLLFDTLPKGIEFDAVEGTFHTSVLFLIEQIFWLCILGFALPAITLFVFVFLC